MGASTLAAPLSSERASTNTYFTVRALLGQNKHENERHWLNHPIPYQAVLGKGESARRV
jgi:hypothetical protein